MAALVIVIWNIFCVFVDRRNALLDVAQLSCLLRLDVTEQLPALLAVSDDLLSITWL